MPEIRTPVQGFSGEVAGVVFTDGTGHTESSWALEYFKRHGYKIVPDAKKKAQPRKAAPAKSE